MRQKSIRNKISARGVGIHSGEVCSITLVPAPANTGIVFYQDSLTGPSVKAHIDNVVSTNLSTTIESGFFRVQTIEHLLSAACGLGVDNLRIIVSGPEIPIMDGSSSHFVFLLQSAGLVEQDAPKKFICITKPVEIVEEENKRCSIEPFDGFKITFNISYQHPVFDDYNQSASLNVNKETFLKEISRSRTYGFLQDYEWLKLNNLAQGANLSNAIAIGEERVVNDHGFRYSDECVKHKILDAVGDLYLMGYPILGHFVGVCSGHRLNHRLLRSLQENKGAWDLVSF